MSVHSQDRNTWFAKLDRVFVRASKSKETVFNNIGHIIDYDMLKDLYYELDGNKAIGVDGITKEVYGNDLAEHLTSLMIRIRRGTYQPQPARITKIPKADGGQRPLAISCIEDKLVQMAVSKILNVIYEPVFLPCSYGFRPSTGCHVALKALNKATINNWNGAIIEVDIKKYFNTIPHNELMEFLKQRIADKRFLQLIRALISMPTLENKVVSKNEIGSPQGSIVSPVLSNIYLHHVIDSWFESIKGTHIRGQAELVRYADDCARWMPPLKPVKVRPWELAMDPCSTSTNPIG